MNEHDHQTPKHVVREEVKQYVSNLEVLAARAGKIIREAEKRETENELRNITR